MKLIITLCTVVLCSVLTVRAEDAPKGKRGNFDPEAVFKKLDTNGDGFLSKDEYLAGPAGKRNKEEAEKRYAKMDTKGDGKVTLEEFKSSITAGRGGKKPGGDAPKTGDAPKKDDAPKKEEAK